MNVERRSMSEDIFTFLKVKHKYNIGDKVKSRRIGKSGIIKDKMIFGSQPGYYVDYGEGPLADREETLEKEGNY
jgi:hypothetical protein